MLTYVAIACQQLGRKLPMVNHLNGLRGMGLDLEYCESVIRIAYNAAEWMGVNAQRWKNIGGVVGWGKEV